MVNISCVEYTTAIMCASLPHLKALASTIVPGYFDSAIRSLREKRQSIKLAGSNRSTTASTQAQSQSRRSMPPPGVLSMNALNLSGRSSVYQHDSLAEGTGAGAGAGADRKKGGSSWLADGNSEEYMLEAVQPGEIWRKTEVEVQVGIAVSSEQRESRSAGTSNWPL